MPINQYIRSLFATLLLALSLPGIAADATDGEEQHWYDVEVLIFSQGGDETLLDEVWPGEISISGIEDAIELQRAIPLSDVLEQGALQPTPFQLLPTETYQLSESAEHLSRSKRNEVLLHVAWRQPGLAIDKAKSVHISDKLKELSLLKDGETGPAPTVRDYIETNIEPEMDLFALAAGAPPRLEGTIKVVLSRYLHLHVDLGYNYLVKGECEVLLPMDEEPSRSGLLQQENEYIENGSADNGGVFISPFEAPETDDNYSAECYQTVHLKESRRMRSKQLHFLDHPLFGMLVLITPYTIPEAEPEPELQEQVPAGQPSTDPGREQDKMAPETIRRN